MANFNLGDYVQVNDRIMKFYEKYPDGSIQTELLKWENGTVVMKAYAYKVPDDPRPATGHAYEKEDASYINKTSALENCETSAVGRALAMLGFEIKKSVASKEEMETALKAQESLKSQPTTPRPITQNQQTTGQSSAPQVVGLCSDCGNKITDGVKAVSEKKYGKPLCMNCQKKHQAVG